ncbi:MAG: tyrosine-type recombinase/integrase [Euryarchaeota archaeon]|nr:tyrosine-type recombinase/integrase [Euryarchaeota archaeon]
MARMISDEQIISQFLKHCELRDMTQKTIENYRSAVQIFKDFLHEHNYTILMVDGMANKKIIEDFLQYLRNDRKVSYARIKIYFSALSALYGFLHYNGDVKINIILTVRQMYVRSFKNGYKPQQRRILPLKELGNFINSIIDIRTKAIVLVFVKTGLRRGELVTVDLNDINWSERSITEKPNTIHKRSFLKTFFDDETEAILNQWLNRRKTLAKQGEKALFISDFGTRLNRSGIYNNVVKWAEILGQHDSTSKDYAKKFSVHNLRHQFTSLLQQRGMPRKYLQMLRGDSSSEVVDLYSHPSDEELRRSYLACMPKFGVY